MAAGRLTTPGGGKKITLDFSPSVPSTRWGKHTMATTYRSTIAYARTSCLTGALAAGRRRARLRSDRPTRDGTGAPPHRRAQERGEHGDVWGPANNRPNRSEADGGFTVDTGRSPAHLVAYVLLG